MKLDEAIVHEKELAEENYMQGMLCHANPNDDELDRYIDNGRYHEQVVKWLEDYKYIKQWKSDIMDGFCRYDASSFEELVANIRNKAIDDFVKIISESNQGHCRVTRYEHGEAVSETMSYDIGTIRLIAEQLKAGVAND